MQRIYLVYLAFFMIFLSACAKESFIDERQIDDAYKINYEKFLVSTTDFGHLSIDPPEQPTIKVVFTNDGEDISFASIIEKGKTEHYKNFFLAVASSSCTPGLIMQRNDSCSYTFILRPDSQTKLINKEFVVRYYDKNNQLHEQDFKLRGSLEVKLSAAFFGEGN